MATIRPQGVLADRYFAPPFGVLSAREGWWQERKRAWTALGLDGRGRSSKLIFSASCQPPASYKLKARVEAEIGRRLTWPEFARRHPAAVKMAGTSIFDPVLAELIYRWFSPAGGVVLDPFAGGAVRGVVASKLGRRYVGIDLRPEQIAANQRALGRLGPTVRPAPRWVRGDACHLDQAIGDLRADLVFTCPPYGDLERYSKRRNDLSNMPYDGFLRALETALKQSAARLRNDRFLCLVVADFRDARGRYRGFAADTIVMCRQAGLHLHNDAMLVNMAATLPVRADRLFRPTRKLGRCHQNVLVFVKGDARRATEACGPVDTQEVLSWSPTP